MPEAPEHRPGHVGHTPQDVGGIIGRARAAAVLTSPAARAIGTRYAAQTFPRLQFPERESGLRTLLRIQRTQERMTRREPGPQAFREGLGPGPWSGGLA